jgi:hypothetical protein
MCATAAQHDLAPLGHHPVDDNGLLVGICERRHGTIVKPPG